MRAPLLIISMAIIISIISCGEENLEENHAESPEIAGASSDRYSVAIDSFSAREWYGYLPEHQLFRLDLKFQSDLESAKISADLQHFFEHKGYPIPADAAISGNVSLTTGTPYSIWMITSKVKRYVIREHDRHSPQRSLMVYDAYAIGFSLNVTIKNSSLNDLSILDIDFRIEDRDKNAVYREYPCEYPSGEIYYPVKIVKILPNGKWSGYIGLFLVDIEPIAEYKLVVDFSDEQIVLELPEYEFDREGSFSWSAP